MRRRFKSFSANYSNLQFKTTRPLANKDLRFISRATDKLDRKLLREANKINIRPQDRLPRSEPPWKRRRLKRKERKHLRKLSLLKELYNKNISPRQLYHHVLIEELDSKYRTHLTPLLEDLKVSRYNHPVSSRNKSKCYERHISKMNFDGRNPAPRANTGRAAEEGNGAEFRMTGALQSSTENGDSDLNTFYMAVGLSAFGPTMSNMNQDDDYDGDNDDNNNNNAFLMTGALPPLPSVFTTEDDAFVTTNSTSAVAPIDDATRNDEECVMTSGLSAPEPIPNRADQNDPDGFFMTGALNYGDDADFYDEDADNCMSGGISAEDMYDSEGKPKEINGNSDQDDQFNDT
ncbi:uncharacterized protein F4822DRAFT_231203 [Hypoxylon trugodes]|uniref:uncharacterized protein n=1 Tax=Hypoxylon trugodes TaxID=326681 RepID=UPI002192E256|nr:uncharacterized protein F4822DRAFT_231203 [Hypoxylon trugodes]KAI1390271.1 hypothetical protein F4822DRAFT_231203 [Hypoxylon trugodes]